jgi:hypothetical protein
LINIVKYLFPKKEILVASYQASMKLLLEEAAQKRFSPAEARIKKLKALVKQANLASDSGNFFCCQRQFRLERNCHDS